MMATTHTPEPVTTDLNRFELVYEGPDVDAGTMSARELVEALSGMTHAFNTVAHERVTGDQYELRVSHIDHRSFHVIFEAIEFAKTNPSATTAIAASSAVILNAGTNTISGIYRIITDIGRMLEAKKRAKGERIAKLDAQFDDHDVKLIGPDEEFILLSKEQYELLLSQKLDKPLAQIVSPLTPRRINRFIMRRTENDLATVDAGEKEYFDFREVRVDQSREGTEITGTLNSLSKTNLKGTFHTATGFHVPYRYTGGNMAELLRGFSAREPLKVHGKIKYGSDGIPVWIDVREIDFLQSHFGE
jgi:hypothetical protein